MSRKKILVVDDSKTALFMVTTILKKEPYELITAHDGQQAVEVAAAQQPDLILMDVIMPRMTGFEACRELKLRFRATLVMPVPIVSANACMSGDTAVWEFDQDDLYGRGFEMWARAGGR